MAAGGTTAGGGCAADVGCCGGAGQVESDAWCGSGVVPQSCRPAGNAECTWCFPFGGSGAGWRRLEPKKKHDCAFGTEGAGRGGADPVKSPVPRVAAGLSGCLPERGWRAFWCFCGCGLAGRRCPAVRLWRLCGEGRCCGSCAGCGRRGGPECGLRRVVPYGLKTSVSGRKRGGPGGRRRTPLQRGFLLPPGRFLPGFI